MMTWESTQVQGSAAITEKLVVSNCLMFSMFSRLLIKQRVFELLPIYSSRRAFPSKKSNTR